MSSEGLRLEEADMKVLCLPLYSVLLSMGNPTVNYFRYLYTVRKVIADIAESD